MTRRCARVAQLMLFAPDDARVARGEYGKVLEQQGHSREALAFLKRAVELQPHDLDAASALGVAYDQLDDHTNARSAYERALALQPHQGSVLDNYAVSRMLAGDYAAARKLFAEAAAQGAANPKVAGNLEKLAALKPKSTAAQASPGVATTPKAGALSVGSTNRTRIAQPAATGPGPQVVMQRVPDRSARRADAERARHIDETCEHRRAQAQALAAETGASRAGHAILAHRRRRELTRPARSCPIMCGTYVSCTSFARPSTSSG